MLYEFKGNKTDYDYYDQRFQDNCFRSDSIEALTRRGPEPMRLKPKTRPVGVGLSITHDAKKFGGIREIPPWSG
jgi:hypothetical protein